MALDNALAYAIMRSYLGDGSLDYLSSGGTGLLPGTPIAGGNFTLIRNAGEYDKNRRIKELESQGIDPNIIERDITFWDRNPFSNSLGGSFSTDDNLKKNINYAFGDFSGNTSEDAQTLIDTLSKLRTSNWKVWDWFDWDGTGDASFLASDAFKNLSDKQKQEVAPWLIHMAKNDSKFRDLLNKDNQEANMYLSSRLMELASKGGDSLLEGLDPVNPKVTTPPTTQESTAPEAPTVNSVGQSLLSQTGETPEEKAQREEAYRLSREKLKKELANYYVDPYANNEIARKNKEYMENRGY